MYDVAVTHRTQLLLDDWQHEALRAISESTGTSLSGLVREAVDQYLARRTERVSEALSDLEGFGSDPDLAGRDHDAALYGERAALAGRVPRRRRARG